MDHPVRRHSTATVRLSITVRWPSITIDRRPSIPATPRPSLAPVRRVAIPVIRRPSTTTVRRLTIGAARRIAIATVLAIAIVLFTAAPAYGARMAMDSGTWDLASHFAAAVPRPDPTSDVLPLLMGSIVVLAVVSASSGHRNRDRW